MNGSTAPLRCSFHPWILFHRDACDPFPWDTSLADTLRVYRVPAVSITPQPSHLSSPSHPRASFTQVLLFACQLFPSTPSHTTSSIAHYQSPTPSSHHPSSDCSNLPRIERNSLGTASWGARCRTENGALLVSCKRPAQPAGIGAALARLFPASPVPSGPVRYGSVRGGAGADPGAPAAAPVERGSRRLVPYHPGLVSRYFTCGAAARLPIFPQRLPDADRLELLR